MELDVGLVAHADVVRESLLALEMSFGDQMQGHVPALRQECDVSLRNLIQADEVEARMNVDHAAGVRADETHPVLGGDRDDFLLQALTWWADFTESPRHDDGPGDPLLPALVEDGRDAVAGRGYQCQIHRFLDVEHATVALQPQDGLLARVDGVDRTFKRTLGQSFHGVVAALSLVARSPHHRHGAGIEDSFQ